MPGYSHHIDFQSTEQKSRYALPRASACISLFLYPSPLSPSLSFEEVDMKGEQREGEGEGEREGGWARDEGG